MTPRADAVRNRSRILTAARDEIAEQGPEAGMDEIARRAGVAVGTLYRHFPTKEALVAAVVEDYMDQVGDHAERRLARSQAGEPADEQLIDLLKDLVALSAQTRAVKAAAGALGGVHETTPAEARAFAAITRLLELGQESGTIPSHVTFGDLYLVVGTAPYEQPTPVRDRWLDLMLTGLMTPQAPPK